MDDIADTLRLLQESLRRFVEKEITPKAGAWEEQGFVPREVLREMGRLGFLGLRYGEEHGGGGLDARATALLANLPAGQVLITTASPLPPTARPDRVLEIRAGTVVSA